MNRVIIFYAPVPHKGFFNLIEKYPDVEKIGILGEEFIFETEYLRKEIRALSPDIIRAAFSLWFPHKSFFLIDKKIIKEWKLAEYTFILPNDDVMDQIVQKYLQDSLIVYDSVFLRWNRKNSLQEEQIDFDEEIEEDFFLKTAIQVSQKSSDWWRQVGAIMVRSGRVIFTAYNKHLPTNHSQYIDGDPRNCFHKGVEIELATAIHAERWLIAKAARYGIATEGSDLYVTTFPCPGCAKQILEAGIKKVFYSEGYAILDAQNIFKAHNIRIVHIKKNPAT